ncbi:MAG: TIGR03013 family PEP-CTERM/XrtA system glycosyltransferase [Edaphobacter sp.]|uniref:TIGR03013 family XrtA/PEP-CTERM system glycosyltransferase n=1 Tax=Edaphobacter sp. TaxID=1934404 RepID=UPI002389E1CF|nr:TIGR03013 family XrtA/PEP-CTERM system glycosyltransferase [Edaphobacter sp.]MDE1178118.1 TIGR03013 family PEP-CTERM/XrtA system glycosyltransferase [Edaphobacter sp.]
MIRLFNVYYPTRTIVLLLCEAVIVSGSFLLAMVALQGPLNASICLNYEYGALKIGALTVLTLLFSYYFDLYEPQRISARWEIYFRLLLVLGFLSFLLSAVVYLYPEFDMARYVLVLGLMFLTLGLLIWRSAYEWIIGQRIFRERVYVLGSGDRARMIVEMLRERRDAGMEVVGFDIAPADKSERKEWFGHTLDSFRGRTPDVNRVIVAMEDRRGELPLRELLKLRFDGVLIEESGALLERLTGKLYLDGLRPSSFIYSEGFRMRPSQQLARRVVSTLTAAAGLLLFLPLFPFVVLMVRLSSPGPIFFRQTRVGMGGRPFTVFKFRTMRTDAEASGAKWAQLNDPRATRVGNFMRKVRLDEVPQLWNVLKGDMGFVGPRPERPEFVPELAEKIPYFELRHMIRPGLTGWAQVRYGYGATIEQAREKLEYDLYYIKHMTLGLDLLIMFETIKTIVRRRGAQ